MIEFVLSGPEAEAQADFAAREWVAAFGYRPKSRRATPAARARGAPTGANVVLVIPPAVVASLDLVQRVKMIRALRSLIDRLPPGIIARSRGTSVRVDTDHMRAVLDLAADAPLEALYDVFLSTTSSDVQLGDARAGDALAAALRDTGLRVFWQGDAMPGDIWPTALWNAQRNALATVALVSATGPARWYQDDDLIRGIQLKRPWDHGFIPVFRDGRPGAHDDAPRGIPVLHSIDLKAAGPQTAARLIARALRKPTK